MYTVIVIYGNPANAEWGMGFPIATARGHGGEAEGMADSNYFLFFKLYRGAPAMGAYLMDYCVDRLRKVALTIMTKVPACLTLHRAIFSPVNT